MVFFLLLSFLSGTVELGSVFLGITMQQPIYKILLLPFFYQIGNLLMDIMPSKRSITLCSLTIVSVFFAINIVHFSFEIFLFQLTFISYFLQLTRAKYKKKCPVWLKRCFRIGGFAASPTLVLCNGQLVFSVIFIVCLYTFVVNGARNNATLKTTRDEAPVNKKHFSSVMLFHQLHYFIYTYIMPIYTFQLTDSILLSACSFAITWIVYLLPQVLTEKYKLENYRTIFFCCHLFLLACLLLIGLSFIFHIPVLALFGWLFTGLGGGSVFCIRHLTRYYETIKMDFSENLGHFGGPLIAALLCRIFSDLGSISLPFVSALCVCLALIIALVLVVKEKRDVDVEVRK